MAFSFRQRSSSSRGSVWIAAVVLVLVAAESVTLYPQLGWKAGAMFGMSLGALLVLFLWRTTEEQEATAQTQAMIDEARETVRVEMEALDERRAEIGKLLMTYGELMEFPDLEELKELEWATTEKTEKDEEVRELVEVESDRMLARFSSGEYWEGGQFQHRLLLGDLAGFMEGIARVYQPGSEKPLLETNLESLLKAVNRASLQVILLLEELPVLSVKDYNLRKMYDGVRTAGKVYQKYEELSPMLDPVRYLWHGSKFLMMSNPLFAAGWIAGSELMVEGSKRLGKKVMDTYLLTLLKQSLGIVAWETASIFDEEHRYRDPDWVYAMELAHLVSQFPLSRDTLRGVMRELGSVPLRSSYDRIFLYRCVTQHVSPKPESFAQKDLMSLEVRTQIVARLKEFFVRYVHGRQEKKVIAWGAGVAARLGVEPAVGGYESAMTAVERLVDCLNSEASFLGASAAAVVAETELEKRDWDLVEKRLLTTRIADSMDEDSLQGALQALRQQRPAAFVLPDLEPGSKLVKEFLLDLADMDMDSPERSLRSYWVIRESAEYFRYTKWRDLERRLNSGYVERASTGLVQGSPVAKAPVSLAFVLPEFFERGEQAVVIYAGARILDRELVVVKKRRSKRKQADAAGDPMDLFSERYLVGTNQGRLLFIVQNPKAENHDSRKSVLVWEGELRGEQPVQVDFSKRSSGEEAIIVGGQWLHKVKREDEKETRVVRLGVGMFRNRKRYFAALKAFCGSE
ncbi:MAG: hypothetical protein L3J39_14480 [Verrucomicrobiales bacterium]|nr:hypothetical protein [Verrucomicrobiales bacterium]